MNLTHDQRKAKLTEWVRSVTNEPNCSLNALSGDASFRRYFVVQSNRLKPALPPLAIDSPPQFINNTGFIEIGALLTNCGARVPKIIASNLEEGFFLVENLGDTLYLDRLKVLLPNPSLPASAELDNLDNWEKAEKMYQSAIDVLIKFQQIDTRQYQSLPHYDAQFLQLEMNLFRDWFLDKHLELSLSADDHQVIEKTFEQLTVSALEQPQTFVHRDYHSRNLIIMDDKQAGIIDFQDAVIGPVSYDLVSLLKDCYICLSEKHRTSLSRYYWQKASESGLLSCAFDHFYKQFEWMGLQRHIKVLGIFCRLNYRDEKPQYLNDLSMTFDYVLETSAKYPQLSAFYQLLNEKIKPTFLSAAQIKNND